MNTTRVSASESIDLTTTLSGDSDLRSSYGEAWMNVDQRTGEVAISFPNRFGYSGEMFNFSSDDWTKVVKMIKRMETKRQAIGIKPK